MATSPPPGWYYELEGKLEGPITVSQLRQLARAGTLKPTDRVRKDGMDKFILARQAKGLFDVPTAEAVPTASAVEEGSIPTANAANVEGSNFDFFASSPPATVGSPASSKPGKAKPAAPVEVPATAFDFYSDASAPAAPVAKEPAKPAAKEPVKPVAKPAAKPGAKVTPTVTDDDPMAAFTASAGGGGSSPFDFDVSVPTAPPPPPVKGAKPAGKPIKDGEKPKDGEKAEPAEALTILDGEITLVEAGTPTSSVPFFAPAPAPAAAAFVFDDSGNMIPQSESYLAPAAPLNVPGGVYAQFTGLAVEFLADDAVRVHADGQTTLSVGQRWITARIDIAGVPSQTVCLRLSTLTSVRIDVRAEAGARGRVGGGQLVLSLEAAGQRIGAACSFAPDVAQAFVEQLLAVTN